MEILVGFCLMASADPWNPTVTLGGPNDESKLPAKWTAVLAVAHFVFAVEGAARPTVSQRDLTAGVELASRLC